MTRTGKESYRRVPVKHDKEKQCLRQNMAMQMYDEGSNWHLKKLESETDGICVVVAANSWSYCL